MATEAEYLWARSRRPSMEETQAGLDAAKVIIEAVAALASANGYRAGYKRDPTGSQGMVIANQYAGSRAAWLLPMDDGGIPIIKVGQEGIPNGAMVVVAVTWDWVTSKWQGNEDDTFYPQEQGTRRKRDPEAVITETILPWIKQ
jgi:hypothetical protein